MADAQAPDGMTASRNENPINQSSSLPAKSAGSVHVMYRQSNANIREVVFGHFPNVAEEGLFQLYIRDQKLKILPAFAFTCVIYLVAQIILELMVPATLSERLAPMIVLFGLIAFLVATLVVLKIKEDKSYQWTSVCIMAMWFVITTAILFSAGTKRSAKSSTGVVGWLQLEFFISFVVLPWRLRVVIAISCVAAVAHSLEGVLLWVLHGEESSTHLNNDLLARQVVANSLLFLGAILLGVLVFLFSDRKQRRSFVESKKSHTISFQLQKEYREQERLLLSVLPKHIADEMIHDLGSDATGGQFRKIYMSRHENVSILFADIVGFTAISSSVTAAELVKILNQLFASFDDLANKYHQQRIKILGDCYYCVCGALDLRKDHGVLSIHMGMSMVDTIRAVRERTQKDVNMRVGIHTGPVLGGVLGQRQWQYDVLGKEVTCANHMESGGIPGRVHISETTKVLLNGEFELEPGNGFTRDDYLKLANLQSYLIKSIIKPYPLGTLDENLDENRKTGHKNHERISLNSEEECNVSQNQQLREALLDRKRSTEAMKLMSYYTTWFHDKEAEARYRARSERFSGASMGALCVVLLLAACAKFAVMPRTLLAILTFLVAELILATMAYISSITTMQKRNAHIPQFLVTFGCYVETHKVVRMLWAASAVALLVAADASTIAQCTPDKELHPTGVEPTHSKHTNVTLSMPNLLCPNPTYFVNVCYLILLSISSLVHIEHIAKFVAVLLSTTFYIVLYHIVFGDLFDHYDTGVFGAADTFAPTKTRMSVQLVSAAIALLILNKKMEEISRHLFLWKEESEKQAKRVADLRQRNEALVYNILPGHVARDFVGRDKHSTELYSHAYDEAAVMFAACPNFIDFYSESAVNNEGLECLRFLNEIISDYDELLKKPQFQSVTKIKTVGPTYMAASGMAGDDGKSKPKTIQTLWKHLDDLVQFGWSMKEVLAKINEQSFNNFILRIGINHGPIIAGVIGVGKPHYDIWGNTVNVASRMESTGMADRIQVVEETKEILEEFGYYFTKRGKVMVKGKGELMTYFIDGQDKNLVKEPKPVPDKPASSTKVSPTTQESFEKKLLKAGVVSEPDGSQESPEEALTPDMFNMNMQPMPSEEKEQTMSTSQRLPSSLSYVSMCDQPKQRKQQTPLLLVLQGENSLKSLSSIGSFN